VVRASTGAIEAFRASKALVRELRDERLGLWASVDHENVAQGALCETEDYHEGFAAFQEKRTPVFGSAAR
jgi:enoyl-CoA hydratase/carnithine racemase